MQEQASQQHGELEEAHVPVGEGAAGRPVVATDVGGAREAIVQGETGYLVAAGDDQQLAEHITALLRDPENARAMGERGQQIVYERFSTRRQLQQIDILYSDLLRTRVSGSVSEVSRGLE